MKASRKNNYRVATVYREKGRKKLVLMIPGIYVREIAVFSHESLSKLRQWCFANNYKIDESRLVDEPKEWNYDYNSYEN